MTFIFDHHADFQYRQPARKNLKQICIHTHALYKEFPSEEHFLHSSNMLLQLLGVCVDIKSTIISHPVHSDAIQSASP